MNILEGSGGQHYLSSDRIWYSNKLYNLLNYGKRNWIKTENNQRWN